MSPNSSRSRDMNTPLKKCCDTDRPLKGKPCLALENIDRGTPRDQHGVTYTLMAGGGESQSSPQWWMTTSQWIWFLPGL